jgi:hypothetical protein
MSGATHTVALDPATWTLEVKGYTDPSHTDLKVSGAVSSVPITVGTQASFEVYLIPNLGSDATGSLAYNISFPGTVSRAFLGFYPIDSTAEPIPEIDLSLGASGTIPDLPEGSYRAVIDLYDGTGNKAAVRSEAVHIYSGLPTPLTRSFNSGDFAACPPKVGDGFTTLGAKLDAALGASGGPYTIVLDGTETDLASFTPKTLSVTGKNISITLRGKGETVQVSGITAAPLFTLSAGLSLELRDITLRGLPNNTVPVVRVTAQGTLAMKAASLITGNTSSSYNGGGGVYSSGTFSMSGGAVSGNTSSNGIGGGGGGVYVSSGTFSMSGGAVSGNISSTSDGGGVYVHDGTFSMSGGAVSGNTSSFGGGVYVGGTFSMSGGAVSGNTSSFGGGVSIGYGTFNMSGGAVSGNSSSYGGGVYVGSYSIYYGTFTMNGGVVSDNALSDTNGYGREVLVGGGTFNILGKAQPERVFLSNNTRFITISGPLDNGSIIPIDLGVTSSLTGYVNAFILKLDVSYTSGNMAALKTRFTLDNSKMTDSPWTEMSITGYEISDGGLFVALP